MGAAWVMNTISIIFIFLFVVLIVFAAHILFRCGGKKKRQKERAQGQPEPGRWLGQALKQRRISCNMTQEWVAKAIGVNRQVILEWESGAIDPSIAQLLALAKLFCISPEELIHSALPFPLEQDKKSQS